MNVQSYMKKITAELEESVSFISHEETEALINQMLQSRRIFVAGAGRSGLMGKSFVMRLMHIGLEAYAVGETVTAGMEEGDLLIIGSGSGETATLAAVTEKARRLGGKTAAVTIQPDSTIGRMADLTIQMPGAPKDRDRQDFGTIQPMGSLFEQTMLVLYDALILGLMEKKGLDSETMYGRHANLE
ncbi:6-phospho-3-hexuloisomerase [Halobacillus halophilus]|uniref:6-phospho-3-hexuloisomerase n=1 Tax=Halobacillus halophilus TaxID=1570 RepID=UPI00136E7B31|nr:6-phospho-3-hexuloisomerase [Halobacillus halophilus]MYL30342.1 6-phospho-3-hexuloisomerase [Halobacillus halophilus]